MLHANENPYALRIGQKGSESFSVLGFSTKNLQFNSDYHITVQFRRRDVSPDYLKQRASLKFDDSFFHGVISQIEEEHAVISSPLYLLNLEPRNAVYADCDFEQLIKTVLEKQKWQFKIDFQFLLKSDYPVLKYIAQYEETDYAFIRRQCSKWGIHFSFIQRENGCILVFCDDIVLLNKQFPELNFPYKTLGTYRSCRKLLPKTVKINDYNPDMPSLLLNMETQSRYPIPSYGIDYRPYEFYQTKEVGQLLLERRMEYYDSHREVFTASTENLDVQLGQRISIKDHPLKDLNGYFYVSHLHFETSIPNNKKHVRFDMIRVTAPFRPELPQFFNMPDCMGAVISGHVDERGCYYISPDFDEYKQKNTNPVRLAQPSSGENSGFHFPLVTGTKVLISHINSDPDRPVIMGIEKANHVTEQNKTQHILKTPAGNNFLMDDNIKRPVMRLNTPNDQALVHMESTKGVERVDMHGNTDANFNAGKMLYQSTEASFIQDIGGSHEIKAKKPYQVKTEKGNMNLDSGRDLGLSANQNLVMKSEHASNIDSGKDINIQAVKEIILDASEMNLEALSGDLAGQANTINIKSKKIILSQGGASVSIDSSGISVNAKTVNFNTGQFNGPQIQVSGGGGGSGDELKRMGSLVLNYVDDAGRPVSQEQAAPYFISDEHDQNMKWAGGLAPTMTHDNFDTSQPVTVTHHGKYAIGYDDKQFAPTSQFKLPAGEKYKIHTLSSPVYKTVKADKDYKFICETLSLDELDYFKKKGNNVIVFIHGYNVDDGVFGGNEVSVNDNLLYQNMAPIENQLNQNIPADNKYYLSTSGNVYPCCRTHDDVVRILKQEKTDESVINYVQKNYTNDSEFLDYVNGSGAHNWLLHMEYNLNCAAVGQHSFPWAEHALDYTRILGIHWPGYEKIYGIPGTNDVNYGNCELNAIASAHALVPIIQSLKKEGLTVNIIAHSMGNLVTLKLLDLLGRWNENLIDNVIMWEAAVPDNALSPKINDAMEEKRAKMDVMASTQKDIQFYRDYIDSVPEKSHYLREPFGYFPFASKAAKQFNVLFSQDDDVLKDLYFAHEDVLAGSEGNVPRYALGYKGLDKPVAAMLAGKVKEFDQTKILLGHSLMRIPSEEVFKKVYEVYVVGKKGISRFGTYPVKN